MERRVRRLVPEKYLTLSLEETNRPELILFIQNAQELEGWNTLRAIISKFPETPVIVLAEAPNPQDVVEAYELGVEGFLIFPFPPKRLAEKLDKHLGESSGWWHQFRCWWQKGKTNSHPAEEEHQLLLETTAAPGYELLPPVPATAPGLYFQLLGPFQIWNGHDPLPEISGYRHKALLAYLAYNRHKHLHREILMEEFWANTSAKSARNSLNVGISSIRRYFRRHFRAGEFILYKNETYQLNPELDVQADVEAFSQWWEAGRAALRHGQSRLAFEAFQQAVLLYHGDFLEDLPYEDWTLALRDNLRETYLQILKKLSEYHFQNNNFPEAGHLFRKILVIDPCLEDIHRHLMFIYTQLGERDRALRQFHRCAEALQRELGTGPSPETRKIYERLLSSSPVE